MIAVLDTHAVLWCLQDSSELGQSSRDLIGMADEADLAISDMTLFEVAMLVHKQRVAVMGSCEAFLEEISRKFCVVPLDSRIAAEAMVLDLPQADPFDRLIVATARRYRLPLITKDVAITQSRLVPIIW